jgi:hypothetical protein
VGASKPLLGANQAQNKLIRLQMLKEVRCTNCPNL